MTDYDLGKARGEVVIETDERGFRRADGYMQGLDRSARRTAEGFEQAEKSTTAFERASKKVTGTIQAEAKMHDNLNRKTREATIAAAERKKAEKELRDVLKDETKTEEDIEKAIVKANAARLEASRLTAERRKMERDLQKTLAETKSAIDALGGEHTIRIKADGKQAKREIRQIKQGLEELNRASQKTIDISRKALSGAGQISSGGAKAMGAGALGGFLGLLGGAALGGAVQGIIGIVGAITELSGAIGTLPGILGSAVAVMGTLKVATAGFADALGKLGEDDFEAGLKNLSQNARDAAWALNALWPMIKAARESIQDNFFKGFADQILRLSQTVMPMITAMMQQLATVMNSTIMDVLDRLQTPENLADLQSILNNIVKGFAQLSQAAVPFFDAFMDIMTVSSSFLPQIGSDIANIAKEFSVWINEMRNNGSLAEWIQTGITAFKQLMQAIGNFSVAFANIFAIADKTGGGFTDILRIISEEFRKWTESEDGRKNLETFFTSISEAAKAFSPILKVITNSLIGDFIPALVNLGTAMAPQIDLFFQNIAAALTYLRPTIEGLAGPIGQFVQAFGESFARVLMTLAPVLPQIAQAFADMMVSLGPELPGIVKGLADAFLAILPTIPTILNAFVQLAKEVFPRLPGLIQAITAILPGCIDLFTGLVNITLGLGNAILTVLGWGGSFLTFMDNLTRVWPQQAGNAIREWVKGIPDALGGMMDGIEDFFSDLWDKGWNAGKDLVDGFKQGIKDFINDAVNSVKDLGNNVVDSLKDLLGIESPSKVFRQLGEYTMQGFAQGITGGTPGAVGAMSTAVGGTTKAGKAGVEQFVDDMLQLTGFGESLLSFVQGLTNIAFDMAKLFTTDLMTGESIITPRWQRTVSDADLRRQKEDEAYQKGLRDTGGVPPGTYGPSPDLQRKLDENGLSPGIGNRVGQREDARTLKVPGSEDTIPLKQNPDGTWTSTNAAWAALIARESGGNPTIGQQIADANGTPGSPNAAQGLFQITPETWRRAGGDRFAASPSEATPEQQAIIAAAIFNGNPKLGGDWGAGPGREDPEALRDGILRAGGGSAAVAGQLINTRDLPAGMAGGDLHPNADLLNRAITAVFGEELKARGLTIGGSRANDSGSGEHQGGALDIMTDALGKQTPEGKALGDRINAFIIDNAEAFGLQWNIWDKEMKYPGGRTESAGERGSITQNHQDHVHAFTGDPDVAGTGTGATGLFRIPTNTDGVPTIALDEKSLARIGTEYREADENAITDQQLKDFLGNNPDLQSAIDAANAPGSSDAVVGSTLDSLQAEIDRQNKIDTPESRYIAGQLQSQQNTLAQDRGFTQSQNPIDTASAIAGGSFSLASDIIGAINEGIKSVGAAKDISGTLVRGIENTEDVMKVVDNIQQFITFGAKIANAVGSGLGLASTIVGASAAGDPSGGASGAAAALGAASSIAGMVSAVLQSVNAAIDLGQEAYKIVSKYVGRFLSNIVGAGQGSLMGDLKFLLDKNDGTLKAWSEDNPDDKRALRVPSWMQGSGVDPIGSKMRDLNLYVGPGTDPNEAMNTGMWMIQADQGGVFSSEY